MWEETKTASPQAGKPPRTRSSRAGGEDWVLGAQALLSLAVLGLVMAAKLLQWPILPQLRTTFTALMQPEQGIFLSDERNFAAFTEEVTRTVSKTVSALWQNASGTATPETATRNLHAKSQPAPSGASLESYLPNFSLVFPLPGQASAKTSGYGWRADPMGGSGTDFHLGNDLAAAEGTSILAAADGIVRVAAVHPSYGNYVRILHENGDETLYAHLQYLFVHVGQPIHQGEQIGTVGDTGNTTGPHLHFELLHKGIRYDPSEALQTAA